MDHRQQSAGAAAKLDDSNERLNRLERSGSDAPAPVSARLERLGRIERNPRRIRAAAGACRGEQRHAVAEAGPGLRAGAQSASVRKNRRLDRARGNRWSSDCRAAGGVVEVSVGEPGAGRVQSIARRGGRWIVATNTGVTPQGKPATEPKTRVPSQLALARASRVLKSSARASERPKYSSSAIRVKAAGVRLRKEPRGDPGAFT